MVFAMIVVLAAEDDDSPDDAMAWVNRRTSRPDSVNMLSVMNVADENAMNARKVIYSAIKIK